MTRHRPSMLVTLANNIKADFNRTASPKRRTFFMVRAGALTLLVLLAAIFSATSSASNPDTSQRATWLLPVETHFNRAAMLMPVAPETIATFAMDCTTPKTSFVLGDTVCAVENGAPLPFLGFRQRRFQWVAPNGTVVQQTDITTDPQSDTYSIPSSGTLALVGTWTVRTVNNSGNTFAIARFVVRDPINPRADLSVSKFGELQVPAGTNATYTINIINRGPDAAQNVQFTDTVPANMTFVSATQNTGPAFTCTNPPSGGTGTISCTIASLANGATATFTLIFQVDTGAAPGTLIENTANISSQTIDDQPADNAFTAPVYVTDAPGSGNQCVVSCPGDIIVNNAPNQFGAVVTYSAPTGTGTGCGAITSIPASGTFFQVGTTIVTAAGETGDPCSFTVTVNDTQVPTISCPADITVSETSPGSGSAIVNYPAPTVTDNDPGVTVTTSPVSGSSFPVGTTTVTATATDTSGNSASCTFTVTVNGTGCSIHCPANITVDNDPDACGANVTFVAPTTNGSCGDVTLSHASGSFFPVGTTTVTATTDSGPSCSFTITVVDAQSPVINSCPADITTTTAPGTCSANVTIVPPTATDNCPNVTVAGVRSDSQPLNAPFFGGTTTITWTATDAGGNTAACEQTVTVNDNIPPVVTPAPSSSAIADANCQAEIPDVVNGSSATDNCSDPESITLTQSPEAGTIVGFGPHLITVTATDAAGNSGSATTTFTVVDNTPPMITLNGANPLTVECHTTFNDPGATATDACAGNFPATASDTVNVNVPGTYTVTYTASDPSGNAATPVTRTVNVVDTTPPVINLNGQAHTMWPPNHKYQTFNVTDFVSSVTDSCGGSLSVSSVTILKVTSDEVENGNGDGNTMNDIIIAAGCKSVQLRSERDGSGDGRVYKITFRVKDASNNVGTATAIVTVPANQGNGGAAVDSGVHYTVNGNCP